MSVGAEHLVRGPTKYLPFAEETVVQAIKAHTIRTNEALKMQATITISDNCGNIVRKLGIP